MSALQSREDGLYGRILMDTPPIFSTAALQRAVDRALLQVPAGHTSAIVAHADLEGMSLTTIVRVDDHWTLKASATKAWHGPLAAEGELIASW